MPKSAAFIRIKAAVLQITSSIPAGKVTTFKAVGDYLDVMPRHVAYILAQLTPEEQASIPWYRVIPDSGKLDKIKYNSQGVSQQELLTGEGVGIDMDRRIQTLEAICFEVKKATTGVDPILRQDSRGQP